MENKLRPFMTSESFKAARKALCLTQPQAAQVLGFSGASVICRFEKGVRPIPQSAARLMAAYLSGYRPDDWPAPRRRKVGAA